MFPEFLKRPQHWKMPSYPQTLNYLSLWILTSIILEPETSHVQEILNALAVIRPMY